MKAWAPPLAAIITALTLAAWALRTPVPAPADAPATAFSANRAMTDVAAIALKPHPMGSVEAAGVQEAVLARLQTLGLQPAFRPFMSPKGPGRNILGVLPGADRQTPAVLLMAHSDSTARGPGAADDGAGVAAILETVRALRASGGLKRDLMVLITDGEEPGLFGAKAFFAGDPDRGHVGVVINLEARGNRGRAVMFETSAEAGRIVRGLIRASALHGSSSLMPDLYRRLPNNTDLTQALESGHDGLNFAFFDGQEAYHRATDTPANLDAGSLQDMGDQVLASARVLVTAKALPARAPDRVYADVLGRTILQYPPGAAWGLLAMTALAVAGVAARALAAGRTSIAGLTGGFLAQIGLIALIAVALTALGAARDAVAHDRLLPLLRRSGWALAGAEQLAAGLTLVWLTLGQRRLTPASLGLGALTLFLLLAIALQLTAPLDAFIVAWPVLLTAVAALAADTGRPPLFALLLTTAALAQLAYWSGEMFALAGQTTPAIMTPFVGMSVMALASLAPKLGARMAGVGLALAAIGAGLSILAAAV